MIRKLALMIIAPLALQTAQMPASAQTNANTQAQSVPVVLTLVEALSRA